MNNKRFYFYFIVQGTS